MKPGQRVEVCIATSAGPVFIPGRVVATIETDGYDRIIVDRDDGKRMRCHESSLRYVVREAA